MSYRNIVTVDFETEKIEGRPKYPPEPVGVALRAHGMEPRYLAWGHPSRNNCERGDAIQLLSNIWHDERAEMLFHNAPFDVSVAVERLGFPMPSWRRIHDTKILLFLFDPHAASMALKPSAERLLDWPAEEQDELYEWIWQHRAALVAKYGGKITRAKTGENSPGAWISKAPGDLVGRYAVGDVDRTFALFQYLHPRIVAEGMQAAYDRERRLMPHLLENERVGLRVDLPALERDIPVYQSALEEVEAGIRHNLDVPDLNIDADRDLAAALQAAGAVHEDAWVTTKTGQLSVAKDNLPPEAFVNPLLASALGYRNRLVTCLKMFMLPWQEMASANRGYIHTSWNQVRSERGGTRTGRPSMTKPNLLNVSKSWEGRGDGYVHPAALGVEPLPLTRRYILADEGHQFVHRDFEGQELRVFAHFECGELAAMYRDNPDLDPHGWVKERILDMTGKDDLDRTSVKIMNFQSLYGGGVTAISNKLKCSNAEAKEFKAFHDAALPGRALLSKEIQRIVRRGDPIRTWGGRLYYVEEPKMIKGRLQTFEYKLINYLVQGSAADITKEVICRWFEGGGTGNATRFLLTVYDEINVSAPDGVAAESMQFLREVMEDVEMDVPMRSSGKIGRGWGYLEKVK